MLHSLFAAFSPLLTIHTVLPAPNFFWSDAIDSGLSKSLNDSCWDILDLLFLSNCMAILAPWDTSDNQNHVQNNVGDVSTPPVKSGHPSWRSLYLKVTSCPPTSSSWWKSGSAICIITELGSQIRSCMQIHQGIWNLLWAIQFGALPLQFPDSLILFPCLKDT